MAVLIAALLAIFGMAVVLYPFLKARSRNDAPHRADPTQEDGPRSREAVYQAIRTLQLEYELGSIEEMEYRELLREYRIQAAEAIKREGSREGSMKEGLDSSLEREIMALRESGGEQASPHGLGRPEGEGVEDSPS